VITISNDEPQNHTLFISFRFFLVEDSWNELTEREIDKLIKDRDERGREMSPSVFIFKTMACLLGLLAMLQGLQFVIGVALQSSKHPQSYWSSCCESHPS